MFKEFKEFALKGNLIDMAVAFVMGAAFIKLSGSFIEDLVMPLIGRISGGIDFSNKFIALSDKVTATNLAQAKAQGAVLSYGNFIATAINFIIVAFVMFLVVKAINKAKMLAKNLPRRQDHRNPPPRRSCSPRSATCSSTRLEFFPLVSDSGRV